MVLDRIRRVAENLTTSTTLTERMDELAAELEEAYPGGGDPVLLFAGDPPMYDHRLPDTYDVCEELDRVEGHHIVRYRPRIWEFEDGTFTLHDGHGGFGARPENVEFSVEVTPDDYVAYRLVRPEWHDPDADHDVPEVYP